jgi:hypothetical protein
MASQVLSGSSNFSYTNTTGQNVRVIINYMRGVSTGSGLQISMSWASVTISDTVTAIGRNLAFVGSTSSANNAQVGQSGITLQPAAFPTEIMLANGQSFSASCGAYNVVVIPEAG